jgi:hypothetical protein
MALVTYYSSKTTQKHFSHRGNLGTVMLDGHWTEAREWPIKEIEVV